MIRMRPFSYLGLPVLALALASGGATRAQDPFRQPPANAEAAKQLEADAARLQEAIRARINAEVQRGAQNEADAARLTVPFPGTGAYIAAVPFDPATHALGATLTPADATLRAQLALPDGQGLVVTEVNEDSLATKIGIKSKDILLTLDDKALPNAAELERIKEIRDRPSTLTLLRGGKPMTLTIAPEQVAEQPQGRWLGVAVGTVDDILRAHLDLPEGQGLVAMEVVPESPAAKAGVKPHDILVSLDDKPLVDIKGLIAQVKEAGDKAVALKLLRAGKPMTVQVTPEPRPKEMAAANPTGPFVPARLRAIRPGVIFTPDGQRLVPPPAPILAPPGGGPQGFLPPTIAVRVAERPDPTSAEILNQLKELRKAVDDLRDSVKKDSGSKPEEGPSGKR